MKTNKDILILGIESSCDETSMSIVKNGDTEICTMTVTQIDIHKKFGGVVPEIASRSHIESITIVLDELLTKANITIDDIDIIEYTKEVLEKYAVIQGSNNKEFSLDENITS